MRTAIGVSSAQPVVVAPSLARELLTVNFTIAGERPGPSRLPDANFAPPGRYVAEILRRLRRHTLARRWLVMNPRFLPSPEAVSVTVATALAGPEDADAVVVEDARGRTAAILFRREIEDADLRVVGAVSAIDPRLDARLLGAAFGWNVEVRRADTELGAVDANGFLLGSFSPVASLYPATALLAALGNRGTGEPEARRRGLRRVAVLPYHAGDLLFLCQALQAAPLADAIVTLEAFAPIARHVVPGMEPVALDPPVPRGPPTPRDELSWVVEVAETAREQRRRAGRPLDGIFHLLRPQRDYNRSALHLRDSLWFTLGGESEPFPELWPAERAQVRDPAAVAAAREVVLHLDGGWPLKGFPKERRPELLANVREAGFAPVILGPPDPALQECRFEPFTTVDAYRALLDGCAGVIAVDSFPAHYAVHHGVPTVYLFASTHPRNSRYPSTAVCETLHVPLPCVPCNDPTTCRLDGGSVCHATGTPAEAVSALVALRERLAARGSPVPFPAPGRTITSDEREALLAGLGALPREEVPACPLCGAASRTARGERLGFELVTCDACGLLYGTRRIRPDALPRLYGDAYWGRFMAMHGYPAGPERYAFDYAHAAERVAYCRAYVPGGAALDVGCGLGAFPRRLAEAGFRAAGLEMPEVAALARRYSGIEVLTELPPERRFDLVTAFDLVEHLYEPAARLRAFAAALRPGGAFVLETSRTDCEEFERLGIAHEDVKPFEHPHLFQERHLRELLERSGLVPLGATYPDGEARARVRIAARKPAEA
jgi:SAM-dependent methyltransferase